MGRRHAFWLIRQAMIFLRVLLWSLHRPVGLNGFERPVFYSASQFLPVIPVVILAGLALPKF